MAAPSYTSSVLISRISSITATISWGVRVSCSLGLGGYGLIELVDGVSGSKGLIGDISRMCSCMCMYSCVQGIWDCYGG